MFGWTQQWKMVNSFFSVLLLCIQEWLLLCRFQGGPRWLPNWAPEELPLLQEWCGVLSILQWKQEAQVNAPCWSWKLLVCKTSMCASSRWYCHFDDDVYVNIPGLISSLALHDPLKQRVYIGRWPLAAKQLAVPETLFPEVFPLPVSNIHSVYWTLL